MKIEFKYKLHNTLFQQLKTNWTFRNNLSDTYSPCFGSKTVEKWCTCTKAGVHIQLFPLQVNIIGMHLT